VERSVVLVKPDGVKRGLVGEVIQRFEKVGLKIVALKMVWANKEMLQKHYLTDKPETLRRLGGKTLKTYEEYGKDAQKEFGTRDELELGKLVAKWLFDYIQSGPVVAILLEGKHAVDNVKSIAGPTMPVAAPPGTIRGDFATDSAAYANDERRGVANVVHISGSIEEAIEEQKVWFSKEEIQDYKRAEEYI
jgi:nucleoside-diphosphate kinase